MIEFRAVTYEISGRQILRDIDLKIETGKFLSVVGPSGAGKTTMLRLAAGLIRPSCGEILLGHRTVDNSREKIFVSPQQRGIGFVFQDLALWPHMTTGEHLAWPLKLAKVPDTDITDRVERMLTLARLEGKAVETVNALSGGEKQRLALARALVSKPEFLLLDEPFSSLDQPLRTELRETLRDLRKEFSTTCVMVTHDQGEAMALGDSVAVMNEGVVEQRGTINRLLSRPDTPFVAKFLGTPPGCLLPAHFGNDGYRCMGARQLPDLPPSFRDPVELYFRPGKVGLIKDDSTEIGAVTILETTPFGDRWHSRISIDGHKIDAIAPCHIQAGEQGWRLRLPAQPDAIFHKGRNLSPKKLVLVRHAMSEWNKDKRLQGQADSILAPEAVAQLQKLKIQLEGQDFDRIEVSPLARAKESAAQLALGRHAIVDGWREVDVGEWQGKLIEDLDASQYKAWRAGKFTPKGGESWELFCQRITMELDRIAAQEGTSLIVCHGGVIRACLQLLLDLPLENMQPSTYASSVTIWLSPSIETDAPQDTPGSSPAVAPVVASGPSI